MFDADESFRPDAIQVHHAAEKGAEKGPEDRGAHPIVQVSRLRAPLSSNREQMGEAGVHVLSSMYLNTI